MISPTSRSNPDSMKVGHGRRSSGLIALAIIGVLVFLVHVGFGSSINYSPWAVIRALASGPVDHGSNGSGLDIAREVVWSLRLPRACGCILAGALLGGAGSAFQSLFRNPLADPYILGTSSGSAIGGVLAIIAGFSGALMGLALPLCAFITGLASLGLVIALARRRGKIESNTLLLSGVLIGSVLAALLTLALQLSGQDSIILRWLLGSVDPMYWPRVWMMLVVLIICGAILILRSRGLNAIALGEETAERLGVDTKSMRRVILLCGTAMTAAAVGSTGIIAFVGLISPHIARRYLGVDWRYSLPGSFLIGGIVLLAADAISQRILSDGLPVGIITALLGAPLLMVLLGKKG